jgi:hypothetical protein
MDGDTGIGLPSLRNLRGPEQMHKLPTENSQLQMPKMRSRHPKPRIRKNPIRNERNGLND